MIAILQCRSCTAHASNVCIEQKRFTFYLCRWRSDSWHPIFAAGLDLKQTYRQRERMKKILTITAVPAATFFALAFVAVSTPAAAASPTDYCRTDVTSGMRGCGYASLEQCQAMSAGRGGGCYANPFPVKSSSSYAYEPKHPHSKPARRPVENR
jgi:hypothetical protein